MRQTNLDPQLRKLIKPYLNDRKQYIKEFKHCNIKKLIDQTLNSKSIVKNLPILGELIIILHGKKYQNLIRGIIRKINREAPNLSNPMILGILNRIPYWLEAISYIDQINNAKEFFEFGINLEYHTSNVKSDIEEILIHTKHNEINKLILKHPDYHVNIKALKSHNLTKAKEVCINCLYYITNKGQTTLTKDIQATYLRHLNQIFN